MAAATHMGAPNTGSHQLSSRHRMGCIGADRATKLLRHLAARHGQWETWRKSYASVCHRAHTRVTWVPVRPSGPWARFCRPWPAPCRLRRARPCRGSRQALPARPLRAPNPKCVYLLQVQRCRVECWRDLCLRPILLVRGGGGVRACADTWIAGRLCHNWACCLQTSVQVSLQPVENLLRACRAKLSCRGHMLLL